VTFSQIFRGENWHHLAVHQPQRQLFKALDAMADINGTISADHITVESSGGMVVLDGAAGSVAAQKLFLLIKAEVLANEADVTNAAAVIRNPEATDCELEREGGPVRGQVQGAARIEGNFSPTVK
jgi:hypothetical protein